MFVAVVETQSNQPYIFLTNRQAASVGASHLLWEACTSWVVEAALGARANDPSAVRTAVRAQQTVGAFASNPSSPIHVVIATSGRAVLLSHRRADLVALISGLSTRAHTDAPGLGLSAGIAEFDWDAPAVETADGTRVGALCAAMGRAAERSTANWSAVAHPEARFRRVPAVRDCTLSPLPASIERQVGDTVLQLSAPAASQFRARDAAQRRIESVLADAAGAVAGDINDLLADWHCVLHADGNGFGALFAALGAALPADSAGCSEGYRHASISLEECGEAAMRAASIAVPADLGPAIYPVVFGGDDVTVVLHGSAAVPFSLAYLREFADRAGALLNELRASLPNGARLPSSLTASAGLAFVKPKFPFHAAHSLADDLCDSAKTLVRRGGAGPAGTLDFHVLYDSSTTSLDDIRDRRMSGDGTVRMFGGPYEVDAFEARYGALWSEPTPRATASALRSIRLGYARSAAFGRREAQQHGAWSEVDGGGAPWSPVSEAIDLMEVSRAGVVAR